MNITIHATPAAGKPGKFIVTAVNGVGELHRDTIDLNSATSRKRFVGSTMQSSFKGTPPDDWPDDVREWLQGELSRLAAVPPGDPKPVAEDKPVEDPRVEALAKMPADVRAEAIALLEDHKLLERIAADVRQVGVVGEQRNALTIYFSGTSSQLAKPLSIIVRGGSASGKSYVVERIAELFPPEVALHATSLTTNALFYFPAGTLRHRWILGGERSRVEDDDKAEATRALREMIEAGKLSKAVPQKVNDRNVTEMIEQDGPIAYVETTTLGKIFEEDANRCLLISTDERQEQTRGILDATAAAAAGRQGGNLDRLRHVHHALQRMLPRCDVVIPFAAAVADLYPTERLDARRSFRHLLVLVKTSALLHYRQRGRDAAGNVVATIDDYAIAEKLARVPLSAAVRGVSDDAVAYLTALREKFGTEEFTTTAAQADGVGSGSRRTKYTRLTDLHGIGAIEQTVPGKGRVAAQWRLTGMDVEACPGALPSVDDVLNRLSGCKHASKP